MYERFYGLRERPFDLLPNPKYLYLTARQREALSNLQYGLSVPRGLTLLVGEAGTGKTTLIQAALAELDRNSIECVLVSNPTLTRDEFYEYLATGFNLGAGAAQSKTRFLFEFRRHLQERHAAGGLSAVVLDEAQSLPYELLEEVRLLSNIETATVKLLNVVLVGQPELADKLNEPGLRQLKQRISLRCQIEPLSFQETAAYIAGRLRIAGGNPAAIFSREAILAIHDASGGVPRLVNVICDNALIGGFAAETRPVLRATVDEVCRDFDLRAAAPAFGSTLPNSPLSERPDRLNADSTVPGLDTAVQDAVARITLHEPASANPSAADENTPLFGAGGRKRFSFFR
jgi:type II secretory pathway predicted ATPase ExeA